MQSEQRPPSINDDELYRHLVWLLHPQAYPDSGPVGLIVIDFLEIEGTATRVDAVRQTLERIGEESDLIAVTRTGRIVVLRAPIRRPAETEALGHNISLELKDNPINTHYIGVAVSAKGDTPAVLMQHAEHALTQASQFGTDQVVVFDDEERPLLEAVTDKSDLGEAPASTKAKSSKAKSSKAKSTKAKPSRAPDSSSSSDEQSSQHDDSKGAWRAG